MIRKTKTAAVIVTYNRIEKLKICLKAFEEQRVRPDFTVVVDNASTDGTGLLLEKWESNDPASRIVLRQPRNLGGAGGFAAGLKEALKLDVDWIWVGDDDAYPDRCAFEELITFTERHDCSGYSAICASVWSAGELSPEHRRRITTDLVHVTEKSVPESEYQRDYFELNGYSFVGTFLNRDKLALAGLPVTEYFIQWDDTEHSLRMAKQGQIICVPSIKADHAFEYSPVAGYQWKDYYGIRNRMDAIRRNFPKRYTVFINIKRIADLVLVYLKPDKEYAKLLSSAVFDAWRRKLGMHAVYRPGWKPKKDQETQ